MREVKLPHLPSDVESRQSDLMPDLWYGKGKEAQKKQDEQKITNEKVDSMYKSRMNKNKKGLNLMKDDFDKKTISFKKRLQEKKKKYISSMTLAPLGMEKENKSFKSNSKNNNKKKMKKVI